MAPIEQRELRASFERRLGATLVAHGLATARQIEEATRQQILVGGQLATNLWELGFVDGRRLAAISAELLGVPEAELQQLAAIPAEVLGLLPREFVERTRILPIGLDRRALRVATCEPWDHLALGEAAFHAGYPVRVYLTPEVPLVRLLARHYGIAAGARFRMRVPAPRHRSERARSVEEVPWDDLPELPAEIATVVSDGAAVAPPPVVTAPEDVRLVRREPAALEPIATLDAAREALDAAADRDEMGGVLVRFALSRGKRVALLVHRRRQWSGWLAAGEGVEPSRIARLILPDEPGTAFGLVSQTGAYFIGTLAAHVVHASFLEALGAGAPGAVALLPVHFRGKLVFGVYLDAGRGADVSTDVAEILVLAQRVPAALERLVKKQLARQATVE